jgi:hypothetical protein
MMFPRFFLLAVCSPLLAAPLPNTTFLEEHCFDCHDAETKKGGLDLTALKLDLTDAATFADWVKVHDRMRDGEMPPPKKKRPPEAETKALLTALDASFREASAARLALEGRALARRLNRDEYQNTLRDLLGVAKDYRPQLPEDGRANGYDKVGSALSVSAEHLQAYMSTAREALDEVLVPGPAPKAVVERYPQRWEQRHFGKDFYTRFRWTFGDQPDALVRFGDFVEKIVGYRGAPEAGMYRFRVKARAWGGETVKARIKAGDERNSNTSWVVTYTEFPPEGAVVEVTTYLRKKDTLRVSPIGIAGPNTSHRVEQVLKGRRGFDANTYQGPGLAMEWVEVEGPLHESWPTPGQRRVFGDVDLSKATRADAEKALRGFLPRVFRRAVTDDEMRHYLKIYDQAAKDADFLAAMKVTLQAAFCSPHFLYLDAPAGVLNDEALAARLSYFLWCSTPDDELLSMAAKGELHQPATLHAEVDRLLKDPKAAGFNESFTGQWLDLRKITATTPDARLYPEWDELIEWSCVKETRMFFDEVLRKDLSVTNFVRSDFAMLNERLAKHYGLMEAYGAERRKLGSQSTALIKVPLPAGSVRGGVMAQASVLKVTANGTTSSPVLRGVWVMDRILGLPVPPPPPGVPAVEPDIRGATTIREQLAKHRNSESCSGCHAKIDPPGFALESFDVIGGWRERYRAADDAVKDRQFIPRPLTFDAPAFLKDPSKRGPMVARVGHGPKVDASGAMPGGAAFAGYEEFRRALLAHPDQLARSLTQHLITYATGTAPQYADRAAMDEIVAKVRTRHHGLASILHEIIASPLFLRQ